MGANLTTPQISLIVLSILMLGYIIGVSVYASESSKTPPTSPPHFTPTPKPPPPPTFTTTPTPSPTATPSPTVTPTPTASPAPHLSFNTNSLAGPPNAPDNFYRLGCQAALSEGLFPFSQFNMTGTYTSGVLCNYYLYDTWGFGNDNNQVNCGGYCISGITSSCSDTSPPASPN